KRLLALLFESPFRPRSKYERNLVSCLREHSVTIPQLWKHCTQSLDVERALDSQPGDQIVICRGHRVDLASFKPIDEPYPLLMERGFCFKIRFGQRRWLALLSVHDQKI